MIRHIGLNINEELELKDFYELELFLTDAINKPNYNHLCLEYWKVGEIFERAKKKNYKTVTFLKDNGRSAYFIRDKAGNLFELKEINHI
jgi:catechol 2,3-dioxygenase-like lactoylglutathione lyase family enzyme